MIVFKNEKPREKGWDSRTLFPSLASVKKLSALDG
jgi:hypothetical protein